VFIRFLWLWLFVWSDEEPFTTSLWGQCQDAPLRKLEILLELEGQRIQPDYLARPHQVQV
jgi:hypothetical protein